jgi:hypothetical protein
VWIKLGQTDADGINSIAPTLTYFEVFGSTGSLYYSGDAASPELAEWAVDTGGSPAPTVTPYQLLEQYSAPDETVTAVFVAGYGIYTERGEYQGQPYYNLLGEPNDSGINSISADSNGYYSLVDGGGLELFLTAAPSLVPWGNIWIDSLIIPTPITQGELDAGVTVSGSGEEVYNGVYTLWGSLNGYTHYEGGSALFCYSGIWSIGGGEHTESSIGDVSFPWETEYNIGILGAAPAPTVTRNDLANLNNWTQINDNVNNAYVPASAPIQPPQAFVKAMTSFINSFGNDFIVFDMSNCGIEGNSIGVLNLATSVISVCSITVTQTPLIVLTGNSLNVEFVDGALLQFADYLVAGFSASIDLSGQTPPAPPTKQDAAVMDASLVVLRDGSLNGKPRYVDGNVYCEWTGTVWEFGDDLGVYDQSADDVEYPWAANWPSIVVEQAPNQSKQALQDSGWTVYTD